MSTSFDRRAALQPDRLVVTPVIVAVNIIVFGLWQLAMSNPALLEFFEVHFIVSEQRVIHGLVWTILTAAFSHYAWWHIAFNMIAAWSFGRVLESLLGRRLYLGFYLGAAIVSSCFHCLVSALIGRGDVGALGASGAVSGVLMLFALLYPEVRILLFGIVPIPALIAVLGFVALDAWGLIAQSQGGGLPIGHGAHLGGALFGAVVFFFYVKPRLAPIGAAESRPHSRLDADEAAEFDRLRLKLSTEGPHSLTPREQDFLQTIRQRVLDDS